MRIPLLEELEEATFADVSSTQVNQPLSAAFLEGLVTQRRDPLVRLNPFCVSASKYRIFDTFKFRASQASEPVDKSASVVRRLTYAVVSSEPICSEGASLPSKDAVRITRGPSFGSFPDIASSVLSLAEKPTRV